MIMDRKKGREGQQVPKAKQREKESRMKGGQRGSSEQAKKEGRNEHITLF